MGKKLFVGNLSFSPSEMDLRAHFEGAGFQVDQVTIVNDRETGQSRGFGFIEMADADAAISKLDGQELDGRELRINEAQERRPRGGGGGGRY